MELNIYQVDAFADTVFTGNPAAVIPLEQWLNDDIMQAIAEENNLSETAFFVPIEDGFHIRWFTPTIEVRLCGHATLATAKVIFDHLNFSEDVIRFTSLSGDLSVRRKNEKFILDFPSDELTPFDDNDGILKNALGVIPLKIFRGRDDYLCIVGSESEVLNLIPDFNTLSSYDGRGIIVSAQASPEKTYDIVSRCFYPQTGVNEDPVTGSAHTTIIPYWSEILEKRNLLAYQASSRGGFLHCQYLGDRVLLGGNAILYLSGMVTI